ncbi:histidine kinase [Acidocella sp.]|uniref:AAA family ATPase n=1 Tax=Acidocella sp. TaxID=50710 RepID=UPI0026307995|nr:histidine kinase [Acidocella sp.]
MSQQGSRGVPAETGPAGRPDRLTVLAFLGDPATEQVLRDGLGDTVANGMDIRRGTVRTAIAAMSKMQTPEVLIVDIAGEEQPLHALGELSDVVEPGVRVLVIGDTDDVDFYRHITRGMGVMEYIFKPITREAVARHFAPLITRKTIGQEATRGGRVVVVMGARGGVGSTTIAGNLAWLLGVMAKRHTVFVESDIHMGSGALLLGGKTGPGLRMALETPDRIDPLFVERAAQPVAERLHVLASEEKLTEPLHYAPGAARRLIEALRVRYNFIIMDVPFLPMACNRELIEFAHHRVIVMDPSLASVRDTLRLMSLPNGPWQPQSPTIVLNRQGRPGGLTRKQIEDALKVKIDIVIPDMPKQLNESASFGEPAIATRGPFRQAIIELSREVGFVAGREDGVVEGAGQVTSVGGIFKMLSISKR